MLYGKAEVARRKQKLAALFDALDGAGLSAELTAHYARYLCVLVSGHAEQGVKALAMQHSRLSASPRVTRYLGFRLQRFANINKERLKQLVEGFDPAWWAEVQDQCGDEIEAFGSLTRVRDAIAHGEETDITMVRVREYFDNVSRVLDVLGKLFDP